MFGEYTPLMSAGLMARRLASGKARLDPEMGLEKRCSRCQEFWPQDTTFWSVCRGCHTSDGLQAYCKACEGELSRLRKEGQTA